MIAIQVDVKGAEELLRLRNGGKRMVYAVANATRFAALEVQKDVRAHVASRFTLRSKRDFILRQAAVITFPQPKAGVVEARVRVGEKRGLLLASYEGGFLRVPVRGGKVAVPDGARPSKAQDIPPTLYIKALALRAVGRRRRGLKGGGRDIQGQQRTYVTPAGIFQRTGRGVTRLLYAFVRPFHVGARLDFLKTARGAVARVFVPELRRQVAETLFYNRNR